MYDEFIDKYIAFQTSLNRSPNTLKAYRDSLHEFFIVYLEEKPMDKITIEDIHLFTTFKQNEAQKREKKGVSGQGAGAFLKGNQIQNSTMNRHFAAVKQFLTFFGYANLSKQVKTLKVQKKFDIIAYEDIKKIFDPMTIRGYYESKLKNKKSDKIDFYTDRFILLLDFVLAHGLRLQEVTDLETTNLKFERKIPVVEVINGKGGKDREVYLSPIWMGQYHLYVKKYPLANKGNKIFTNYNGGALSYSTIRTYVKTLGYYIGVPKLSFHKLRHCYALKKYEKTKDIVELSKSLGHDSIQTTMIYLSRVGLRGENQVDVLAP